MRIEYHRTLIADRVRNQAIFAALRSAIRKGETVVADIGTGTGLIGLMAARLGAKEVYLYEMAEVAGVAAEVLKRNRARNCHLMACSSMEMIDPPRADLVVSETLGNYAFEENMIATLEDARRRHLKAGGIVIPSKVRQLVAPVTSERFDTELRAWDRVGGELGVDIDLSFPREMSFNNIYVRTIGPRDLLDQGRSAVCWDTADFASGRVNSPNRKGEAAWKLDRAAVVYGLAVWWEASLAGGVALSTAPAAKATHWEQLYFPLAPALELDAGETLQVGLKSQTSEAQGTHLAWKASRLGRKGHVIERRSHDLDKGYLP